ncbi:MAG: hypothetical protein D6738_09445 [Acidobacteria bacterium]|nr:MAG: hypothetical protein D6738_09445 [Acidobacteriota bacterium]
MSARFRVLGPGLLVVTLACTGLTACRKPDPRAQLLGTRNAYEVAVVGSWAQVPATDDAPPAAVLTIRVTRGQTSVTLPCLTVDVLFYGKGESGPVEIGRQTVELDLTDLEQLGGTKEILKRLPLPADVEIEELGLVLHDPGDDEGLRALCEAKAFPELLAQ